MLYVVPGAGIEPARPFGREILSLLCLPISPSGQKIYFGIPCKFTLVFVVPPEGLEPPTNGL